MTESRSLVNALRSKIGLDAPSVEEIALVRQSLLASDTSVKQMPTDFGNHLIRVIGLQARLQELMQEPLRRFVGIPAKKAAPKADEGTLKRAQVHFQFLLSPSHLLIVHHELRAAPAEAGAEEEGGESRARSGWWCWHWPQGVEPG